MAASNTNTNTIKVTIIFDFIWLSNLKFVKRRKSIVSIQFNYFLPILSRIGIWYPEAATPISSLSAATPFVHCRAVSITVGATNLITLRHG
jgi:hypothetical protein